MTPKQAEKLYLSALKSGEHLTYEWLKKGYIPFYQFILENYDSYDFINSDVIYVDIFYIYYGKTFAYTSCMFSTKQFDFRVHIGTGILSGELIVAIRKSEDLFTI